MPRVNKSETTSRSLSSSPTPHLTSSPIRSTTARPFTSNMPSSPTPDPRFDSDPDSDTTYTTAQPSSPPTCGRRRTPAAAPHARTVARITLSFVATPGPFAHIHALRPRLLAVRDLDDAWARGVGPGRALVLKVRGKAALAASAPLEARALREVRAYRRIDGESRKEGREWVLRLHAVLGDGDGMYFVTDYMCCTLKDLPEMSGLGDWRANNRKWICQIINGLAAIHGSNLVHNALAPEHIFLDFAGNIKIGGFSACVPAYPATPAPPVQPTGVPRAPEHPACGPAGDLWALGFIVLGLEAGEWDAVTFWSCKTFETWYEAQTPGFPALEIGVNAAALATALLARKPKHRPTQRALARHCYFGAEGSHQAVFNAVAQLKQIPLDEQDITLERDAGWTPNYTPGAAAEVGWVCATGERLATWVNPRGAWGRRVKGQGRVMFKT